MVTLSLAALIGLFLFLSTIIAWLYFYFKKQLRDVRNSSEARHIVFGPGPYRDEYKDWTRKQRKIRKKYLLSFKWIWYWLTKEAIKNRKLRRESSKILMDSMKARQLKIKKI